MNRKFYKGPILQDFISVLLLINDKQAISNRLYQELFCRKGLSLIEKMKVDTVDSCAADDPYTLYLLPDSL